MTFEEAWAFTDTIHGSFTKVSSEKLFEYACRVPENGVIVEVGVDQGRSASLLMAAVGEKQIAVILIDSWESVLIDNKAKVEALSNRFPCPVVIIHGKSTGSSALCTGPIDLLHIDADHYDGIAQDCEKWLPKLKPGGVVCFHDYESCFPAVTEAVNKYTAGWDHLGNWDGLAIRRKP